MQQDSLVSKPTSFFTYLVSGGTPNATIVIPSGFYFQGIISFQARINTLNIPCVLALSITAGELLLWIQSQPSSPIDTLDTAGNSPQILLGPGSYTSSWVSGPDIGTTNYISAVGMLIKL